MTRTTTIFSTLALAIGSIVATSAHAIPIVFEFTGAVTYTNTLANGLFTQDYSRAGEVVTGRITIETEGLVQRGRTYPDYGTVSSFNDIPGTLTSSEVSINGIAYDMAIYPESFGHVQAFDSSVSPCGPGCAPVPDFIELFQGSGQDYYTNSETGEFYERMLNITWVDAANPFGLVDLSVGFQPIDVISSVSALLPQYGYFGETIWTCVDGDCVNTGLTDTMFSISSLTITTPSVPEPGTLALFAVGLLGGAVARRSAVKAR